MRKSQYEAPLTDEERDFAAENYYLVKKYLNIRRLSFNEWHDVVIFRYLLSVKRWFALPELHEHNFEIIAFYAMRSAIGHEVEKRKRRIKTISLDELYGEGGGFTLADLITYDNYLNCYITPGDYGTGYTHAEYGKKSTRQVVGAAPAESHIWA